MLPWSTNNAQTNSSDIAEQLTKIAKPHADGVLDDDDFKKLKDKIIQSTTGGSGATASSLINLENRNKEGRVRPSRDLRILPIKLIGGFVAFLLS